MNFDADLHVAMRKAIFEISVPREPQVLFRIDHVEGGGGRHDENVMVFYKKNR